MCQSCTTVSGTLSGGQCTNTNSCAVGTYFAGTTSCDTCPAAGYSNGTYSNGQCTNSCPTGYTRNGTTAYCYPTGNVTGTGGSAGFYCPTGDVAPVAYNGGYVCYPTGLSYNSANGDYCPSGQTITGAFCYPSTTGLSKNTTTFNYCPTGQTIKCRYGLLSDRRLHQRNELLSFRPDHHGRVLLSEHDRYKQEHDNLGILSFHHTDHQHCRYGLLSDRRPHTAEQITVLPGKASTARPAIRPVVSTAQDSIARAAVPRRPARGSAARAEPPTARRPASARTTAAHQCDRRDRQPRP